MACSVLSLVVFLSFCIPRGGGGGGNDCVCMCVLAHLCLFVIASVMSFVIWPCWCVHLLFCGLPCQCVRVWMCVYICACAVSFSVVASRWSVFLFSGSAPGACSQALHHASQCWGAPERRGQTEEALRRGDCSPAGTVFFSDFRVLHVGKKWESTQCSATMYLKFSPWANSINLFQALTQKITSHSRTFDWIPIWCVA